jgi:hypothetical protein
MTSLVFGIVLVAIGFFFLRSGRFLNPNQLDSRGVVIRVVSGILIVIGSIVLLSSTFKVIDAGQVGVQHAFGRVYDKPLLPGIRVVWPW